MVVVLLQVVLEEMELEVQVTRVGGEVDGGEGWGLELGLE